MRLKYNIIFQQLGDTYLGITVGQDAEKFPQLLTMNETTYDIARHLTEEISFDVLLSRFLNEYDVSEVQARQVINDFLQYLQDFGVLEQ